MYRIQKYLLTVTVFLIILFISANFDAGINAETEKRDLEKFNKVELAGAFNTRIIISDHFSIKIEGNKKDIAEVITEVSGNVLEVKMDWSYRQRDEINLVIYTKSLEALVCSGANKVEATDLKSDEFNLEVSGAGDTKIAGECRNFTVSISGAGNLEAADFKAKKVHISISGAGNAEIYAAEGIDATVSGASKLIYYGNPKDVDTDITGASVIKSK
ncbi:MAG: DUF2807 domain-containing protein [Ignavibacteriales bacterium]|nr:DUF2807 domain-containing protein [Ignavibacteriales bacterium]MCF8435260.1 DUF2807 domain-containing protein [Ignavibacteriales bacterium]